MYDTFSLDKLSSQEEDSLAAGIASSCSAASVAITDVGHAFDAKIQNALAKYSVKQFAYYDNPEPYVPGGYSAVAAEVMKATQGVLFANANLATQPIYQEPNKEVDLSCKEKVGIGYYPVQQAEKIALRRAAEHVKLRKEFLLKYGFEDKGQKIVVYFGGNNEEYFKDAFPSFLSILTQAMCQLDMSNTIFVIQQHPAAKEKNYDGKMLIQTKKVNSCEPFMISNVILSDFSSDDAQVLADGAMYYQTSMVPQFLLAGIPTMQIGHKVYEDILVNYKLGPTLTLWDPLNKIQDFLTEGVVAKTNKELIFKALGFKNNWLQELKKIMNAE